MCTTDDMTVKIRKKVSQNKCGTTFSTFFNLAFRLLSWETAMAVLSEGLSCTAYWFSTFQGHSNVPSIYCSQSILTAVEAHCILHVLCIQEGETDSDFQMKNSDMEPTWIFVCLKVIVTDDTSARSYAAENPTDVHDRTVIRLFLCAFMCRIWAVQSSCWMDGISYRIQYSV